MISINEYLIVQLKIKVNVKHMVSVCQNDVKTKKTTISTTTMANSENTNMSGFTLKTESMTIESDK